MSGLQRHAAYIPVSALTDAEYDRYRRELVEKGARWPSLYAGEAAKAGLRARIVSERRERTAPVDGGLPNDEARGQLDRGYSTP